jgi:hypothetical protein
MSATRVYALRGLSNQIMCVQRIKLHRCVEQPHCLDHAHLDRIRRGSCPIRATTSATRACHLLLVAQLVSRLSMHRKQCYALCECVHSIPPPAPEHVAPRAPLKNRLTRFYVLMFALSLVFEQLAQRRHDEVRSMYIWAMRLCYAVRQAIGAPICTCPLQVLLL